MLTDLRMFTLNRLSKFGRNNKVDLDFDCLHIVDVVVRVVRLVEGTRLELIRLT